MRLLPRSLYGRLLALSAIMTGIALIAAGFTIGHVLDRFVVRTYDDQLSQTLFALRHAVKRDGTIDAEQVDRFDRMFWHDEEWRVDTPHGVVGTALIGGQPGISYVPGTQLLGPAATRHGHGPQQPHAGQPDPPFFDAAGSTTTPFDARTADGEAMHGRWESIATEAGPAIIAVAVPRELIDRPIRRVLVPLALSLLVLGVALALATLVQLRIGLRPLATLRRALGDVRAGRAARVPGEQPAELAPLAAELNALLDQNETALAQARGHVANLAHGLKTPLATLALELDGRDPDGRLAAQVERIAGAVRHHLGRARAAAPGSGLRRATPLAPAVAGLVAALGHIHADRRIAASVAIAPDLTVAVDTQDLDELVGNLLDNAWRWARTAVVVTASEQDAAVRLSIADDGPGIPPDARAAALAPGRRLDEAGEGHGFGLSIARELVELHGGTLALATSATGGLDAIVSLPRRRAAT